jgi:hypothetical protein
MGFQLDMFSVEMLEDPEQNIARPRQIYTGPQRREFRAMEQRSGREFGSPVRTSGMPTRKPAWPP